MFTRIAEASIYKGEELVDEGELLPNKTWSRGGGTSTNFIVCLGQYLGVWPCRESLGSSLRGKGGLLFVLQGMHQHTTVEWRIQHETSLENARNGCKNKYKEKNEFVNQTTLKTYIVTLYAKYGCVKTTIQNNSKPLGVDFSH